MQTLTQWFSPSLQGALFHTLWFELSLILTLTAVTFGLWHVFAKRLGKLAKVTRFAWDDVLWFALAKPISIFILLMGASLFLSSLLHAFADTSVNILPTLQRIIVLASVAWVAMRFVSQSEVQLLQKGRDHSSVTAISKLLHASIVILFSLSLLQSLGFSISGVLAFGGMGGLVVGMAARDLLSNFFGALILYLDKPFKVGDWVRSPDRNIEGTVERIGWRVTQIRTFDKRPLYIPNSVFSSIVVENPSRMSHRRIYENIGLRYADAHKLAAILYDVEQMLRQHDEIASDQTLMVNFNQFAASSLDFFIYTFTKTTDWQKYHAVKQDVLQQVLRIIEQHQAEIAFPTQTLQVHNAPPQPASASMVMVGS